MLQIIGNLTFWVFFKLGKPHDGKARGHMISQETK